MLCCPFSYAATIASEFCLVNSSSNAVSINRVWLVDEADWKGDFLPSNLVSQVVEPYSAQCWPLEMVKHIIKNNTFHIEIKTDKGVVVWLVKQNDAVDEIYKVYNTLSNDTDYTLVQKAGDNNGYATNVFIVEQSADIQDAVLSNWMQQLPDSRTLKDTLLIGAHDAGINQQDDVSCDAPSGLTMTQAWNLLNQLHHGVRYFDIRLEGWSDGKMYPYHKIWGFGCTSRKSFESSLESMLNFIKQHPSEAVFLKLSHTSADIDKVVSMLDQLTASADNEKYIYKSDMDLFDWSGKTIGELRGKIILLLDCEYAKFFNPEKGYFGFSLPDNNTCSPDDGDKVVYDKYTNTKNFDLMYQDQLNKLTTHSSDKKALFLLSWTLTGGDVIAHVPRPAAYIARLSHEKFGKSLPTPNIVYYDFEDPGVNHILIANAQQNNK